MLASMLKMSITKSNIQTVCSYFHIACTLFLFGCIPFYYSRFTQYGLIFFFSSFVIDYLASERWKEGFKLNKNRIISALILLQFLLLFIYSFFEKDTRYLSAFYEYRFAFLGFGIVGLLGVSDKFRVRHFAYATVLTVTIFLISLYLLLPDWFENVDGLNKKLQVLRGIRALDVCSHMTINIFLCVGMVLFAKILSISSSKLEKSFSILMIIIYFTIVLLSDGRIGMFNACLLLGCIIVRFSIKKLKYLILTLITFVLIVFLGLIILNSNNPIRSKIKVLNKTNPREYIWQEGKEHIFVSPITGRGASTNALEMKERLLANKELCSTEKFLIGHLKDEHVYAMHPHNQIMQSWQEYGIVGLLAILGLFVAILWASKGSLSLNLIFIVIFFQLQTEVIDGGITTIGFCTYIYLILALINSGEMGKEKIGRPKWISRSPRNT